jgi:hypothetical protein
MKKIMNIIYDEDFDTFKKNHIQFIRNCMYEDYLQKKYIIRNTHYIEALKYINMVDIFPGCLIVILFVKNNEYALLNLLLDRIKNKKIEEKKDQVNLVLQTYHMNNLTVHYSNFLSNSYDKFIEVDVGKLYFEDGYEDEAEKILSAKSNIEIKLDREMIKKYRKGNMDLLAKTYEIKNVDKLTPKKLLENILKKYGPQ